MTQAFNLLKREGGRQKHRVRNIWGEMIESRVIIEYYIRLLFPREAPPKCESILRAEPIEMKQRGKLI
jgi:hypothetical protein